MTESLPPYSVKVSQRARSVRLQISRDNGLVITVPKTFNQRLLPGILQSKLDWIRKTIDRINRLPVAMGKGLPDKLTLTATNETWLIVYRTEPDKKVTMVEQSHGKVLVISGKISSKTAVHRLLKGWLKDKAVRVLPDWLERISRKTGLPFQKLTIRDQKTRWGSCSAKKNINLNFRLIFLPVHLVDYVMIHELCHTQVLSHSSTFWKLVASFYPQYKEARKQLREMAREIPIL
jgi:predicted metal-dependent hydrolase